MLGSESDELEVSNILKQANGLRTLIILLLKDKHCPRPNELRRVVCPGLTTRRCLSGLLSRPALRLKAGRMNGGMALTTLSLLNRVRRLVWLSSEQLKVRQQIEVALTESDFLQEVYRSNFRECRVSFLSSLDIFASTKRECGYRVGTEERYGRRSRAARLWVKM